MGGETGLPHEPPGTARERTSEGLVAGVDAQMSFEVEALGKLFGAGPEGTVVKWLTIGISGGDGTLGGVGVGGVECPVGGVGGYAHGPIHDGGAVGVRGRGWALIERFGKDKERGRGEGGGGVKVSGALARVFFFFFLVWRGREMRWKGEEVERGREWIRNRRAEELRKTGIGFLEGRSVSNGRKGGSGGGGSGRKEERAEGMMVVAGRVLRRWVATWWSPVYGRRGRESIETKGVV